MELERNYYTNYCYCIIQFLMLQGVFFKADKLRPLYQNRRPAVYRHGILVLTPIEKNKQTDLTAYRTQTTWSMSGSFWPHGYSLLTEISTSDKYKIRHSGRESHLGGVGTVIDLEREKNLRRYWALPDRKFLVKWQAFPCQHLLSIRHNHRKPWR